MNGRVLKFKKSDTAFVPVMATSGSAGYDFRSPVDFVIKARDKIAVNVGVKLELPSGTYAQIHSRSGMAFKQQIVAQAGVIDNDYRDYISVLLFNLGKKSRVFKRGDKIAQFIVLEYCKLPLKECEDEELSSTVRGTNGFGSTGR